MKNHFRILHFLLLSIFFTQLHAQSRNTIFIHFGNAYSDVISEPFTTSFKGLDNNSFNWKGGIGFTRALKSNLQFETSIGYTKLNSAYACDPNAGFAISDFHVFYDELNMSLSFLEIPSQLRLLKTYKKLNLSVQAGPKILYYLRSKYSETIKGENYVSSGVTHHFNKLNYWASINTQIEYDILNTYSVFLNAAFNYQLNDLSRENGQNLDYFEFNLGLRKSFNLSVKTMD